MTPLEIALCLIALVAVVVFLAFLWADALDRASATDWEAEGYAELVRRKHDAANEILGYTAQHVEMASMAAAHAHRQKTSTPKTKDVTVLDAEYTVHRNG